MPNLTCDPTSTGTQLFQSTTTPQHALGARMVTADGRVYRYCLAGAVDLVAGNCIQAPAQLTNHQQLTPSVAAIGATTIVATLGATAAAANLYAGGLAIIDTTPGLGYSYPVLGHAAVLSAGVITLTLPADSAIQVALTASSRVSLQANPYSGVIQTPVTTLTGAVVGVAVFPIPANTYGWIQTHGPCGCLINVTPAVGQEVSAPSAVAGALAINSGTLPPVGWMMVTGVDTKVQAVFLTID